MHTKLLAVIGLCLITGISSTVFGQSTEKEGFGERRGGRSGFGGRDGGNRDGGNRDGGGRRGRGGETRGGETPRSDTPRGAVPRSTPAEAAPKTDVSGTPVRHVAGRTGNKKTAAALTLPSQYVAKDANKDGQIGVYEWSKTDLSTFRKLDLNGDGFLIPSEFANPGTRVATPAAVAATSPTAPIAAATPSNSVSSDEDEPEQSTSIANSETTIPVVASVAPNTLSADPVQVEVEKNFVKWDKNANGQLDQDEFDGVMRLERIFEKANMKFQGPMPKDKFLETYLQALKTKSTKST